MEENVPVETQPTGETAPGIFESTRQARVIFEEVNGWLYPVSVVWE